MRIEELIPILKKEAESENEMFSGSSVREFFIESVGARGVGGLLDMFDPKEHNEAWDAARQRNPVNLDDTMLNRRAIDFMMSGKMGVHRRYAETELGARIAGRHRMYASGYMLDRSLEFMTMKRAR